jgi:hypothetical protein
MQEHHVNVQQDAVGESDMATSHVAEDDSVRVAEQASDKLVPVSEAIRYRKRAQAAEHQLDAQCGKLVQMQQELDESQETIHNLERRQKIDAMLTEADADKSQSP